jgi:anti-sigma factor RsiW
MTCQELVELVTEYFEGTLDPERRAAFEHHLGVCPGCLYYVEQLRTTMRLVHDVKELEQRPEMVVLLETFRGWRSTP